MAGLYIGIWTITSVRRTADGKSLTMVTDLTALSIIQTLEHTLLVLRTVKMLDKGTKSARKLHRPLSTCCMALQERRTMHAWDKEKGISEKKRSG